MSASPVTEVEAKTIHEVLKVAQTKSASDDLDKLIEKHKSWRALHVGTWIVRFVKNARVNQWVKGPLTIEEIESQRMFWIQRFSDRQDQQRATRDMIHLNVRTNQDAWGARMQRKNSMKLSHIPRWHNRLYSQAGGAITLGYST